MNKDEHRNILAILLHGVGSSGADMMGLARALALQLPGMVFAAPDAPSPAGFGHGRQWFNIDGVTAENRPGRIVAARPDFNALISAIIAEKGYTDHLDRVLLIGFSQGSMMALDAVSSGRWPVAAAIAFSGRLATSPPFVVSPTRLLLLHGDADPVVPVQETLRASDLIGKAGFNVSHQIFGGLGHSISAEGVKRAVTFIQSL